MADNINKKRENKGIWGWKTSTVLRHIDRKRLALKKLYQRLYWLSGGKQDKDAGEKRVRALEVSAPEGLKERLEYFRTAINNAKRDVTMAKEVKRLNVLIRMTAQKKIITKARALRRSTREKKVKQDCTFQYNEELLNNSCRMKSNSKTLKQIPESSSQEIFLLNSTVKESPVVNYFCSKSMKEVSDLETVQRTDKVTNISVIHHIRAHNGEKLYQCTHCKINFSDIQRFKNHMILSGHRHYLVDDCVMDESSLSSSIKEHSKNTLSSKIRSTDPLLICSDNDEITLETLDYCDDNEQVKTYLNEKGFHNLSKNSLNYSNALYNRNNKVNLKDDEINEDMENNFTQKERINDKQCLSSMNPQQVIIVNSTSLANSNNGSNASIEVTDFQKMNKFDEKNNNNACYKHTNSKGLKELIRPNLIRSSKFLKVQDSLQSNNKHSSFTGNYLDNVENNSPFNVQNHLYVQPPLNRSHPYSQTGTFNDSNPPYSISQLIIQAISLAKEEKLTVNEIYFYILKNYLNYPHYRHISIRSIKETLSSSRNFLKVLGPSNSNSSYWKINTTTENEKVPVHKSTKKNIEYNDVSNFKQGIIDEEEMFLKGGIDNDADMPKHNPSLVDQETYSQVVKKEQTFDGNSCDSDQILQRENNEIKIEDVEIGEDMQNNSSYDRENNLFGQPSLDTIHQNSESVTINDSKPPYSYSQLITQAIISAKDEKLTTQGIFSYIRRNYPYYRHIKGKEWMSSIMQVLWVSNNFVKVPNPVEVTYKIGSEMCVKRSDRGNLWRINRASENKLAEKASKNVYINDNITILKQGNIETEKVHPQCERGQFLDEFYQEDFCHKNKKIKLEDIDNDEDITTQSQSFIDLEKYSQGGEKEQNSGENYHDDIQISQREIKDIKIEDVEIIDNDIELSGRLKLHSSSHNNTLFELS